MAGSARHAQMDGTFAPTEKKQSRLLAERSALSLILASSCLEKMERAVTDEMSHFDEYLRTR